MCVSLYSYYTLCLITIESFICRKHSATLDIRHATKRNCYRDSYNKKINRRFVISIRVQISVEFSKTIKIIYVPNSYNVPKLIFNALKWTCTMHVNTFIARIKKLKLCVFKEKIKSVKTFKNVVCKIIRTD